jgi:hypothetical protein
MIRQDITRIAQANIQVVLVAMLDKIEALEEALDAQESAPMVVHGPEVVERLNKVIAEDNTKLEEETLEVENDYVQQNLEEEETE